MEASSQGPSFGTTLAFMALFAVLGIPIVAYLWESLMLLLEFNLPWTRLALSIPLALALYELLRELAKQARRLLSPAP